MKCFEIKVHISSSHGGEYKDGWLVGCCAVQSGKRLPTFQKCLLLLYHQGHHHHHRFDVEAANASATSVILYQTERRNKPGDRHLRNEVVGPNVGPRTDTR
jgi:hypothetical protein